MTRLFDTLTDKIPPSQNTACRVINRFYTPQNLTVTNVAPRSGQYATRPCNSNELPLVTDKIDKNQYATLKNLIHLRFSYRYVAHQYNRA